MADKIEAKKFDDLHKFEHAGKKFDLIHGEWESYWNLKHKDYKKTEKKISTEKVLAQKRIAKAEHQAMIDVNGSSDGKNPNEVHFGEIDEKEIADKVEHLLLSLGLEHVKSKFGDDAFKDYKKKAQLVKREIDQLMGQQGYFDAIRDYVIQNRESYMHDDNGLYKRLIKKLGDVSDTEDKKETLELELNKFKHKDDWRKKVDKSVKGFVTKENVDVSTMMKMYQDIVPSGGELNANTGRAYKKYLNKEEAK